MVDRVFSFDNDRVLGPRLWGADDGNSLRIVMGVTTTVPGVRSFAKPGSMRCLFRPSELGRLADLERRFTLRDPPKHRFERLAFAVQNA